MMSLKAEGHVNRYLGNLSRSGSSHSPGANGKYRPQVLTAGQASPDAESIVLILPFVISVLAVLAFSAPVQQVLLEPLRAYAGLQALAFYVVLLVLAALTSALLVHLLKRAPAWSLLLFPASVAALVGFFVPLDLWLVAH